MGGLRLLHKSTFHAGHFPVSMHLLQSSLRLPSTSEFLGPNASQPLSSPDADAMDIDSTSSIQEPLHQILHTTQSGTLALLTPLPESSYRRLSGLATFLSNNLDSACSLNPRAYRAVENEGGGGGGIGGFYGSGGFPAGGFGGTRGVVDGNLLMRWGELGEQRRREGLGKVGLGGEEWRFRAEREILIGRGVWGR